MPCQETVATASGVEPPRAPHAQTIGLYRILSTLGRGGMGVVYGAMHLHSGEPAAVKTVNVPHQCLLQSIRREIHALARIRHPGVVRILDEGVQDGVPWYAMELVEGKTLGRHCAELTGGTSGPSPQSSTEWPAKDLRSRSPRIAATGLADVSVEPRLIPAWRPVARARQHAAGGSLLAVLGVVRRLCAALAFLHGEGLVHRDLKPGNVLVRPDGTPVLVDFGLAGRFEGRVSREELVEIEGSSGGTLAYMAPEQGRGELVDARADLYSLGCILYELVTGRVPFLAGSAAQLLRQHFESPPIPPSQLVDAVPPGLEALILRLLAKRPQDRLGHAGAVAAALEALGVEARASSDDPQPRVYLYRPGFVDRDRPFAELREHLVRLECGAGGLVLVGGESGIGKTRLLMELARQRRRAQVLAGGVDAGAPLQALRRPLQAIADRCRERGLEETERLLGRRGKLLCLHEPALRGLPGQDAHPEPAELAPEAARLRLLAALTETFAALAEDRPVLLLLDDLHWADDLTLGWLELLLQTRRLERTALLVVGAYRTEEIGAPLQRLLDAPDAFRIDLGRLEEPAVGAMAGEMMGQPAPPEPFVRFLSRQSDGNPFFVAELLRTAVAEGLLCQDSAGRWQIAAGQASYEALPLPRSLRQLVARRLDGLSDAARHLAEIAAVLGREMDEELLLAVARRRGTEAMEAIQRLLARQVLEPADGARLRFVHDQIRDVAYGRIVEGCRQRLHRAAAEALEPRAAEGQADAGVLGSHWEKAGEAARAGQWYLAAARHARDRYSPAEAERLYRAFLRVATGPALESVEARNELASDILRIQGRCQEALAELGRALEEARQIGAREAAVRSLLGLGSVQYQLGRPEDARALYEQGLAEAREAGDPSGEAQILTNLAAVDDLQGRGPEVRALLDGALELYRRLGDRRGEGIVLDRLGMLLKGQGRLDEALGLYERSLGLHKETGNRLAEAFTVFSMAMLHSDRGQPEEACRLYERALILAREVSEPCFEGKILDGLATQHYIRGRLQEALELYERALALHRSAGLRVDEGITLLNIANLYQRRGHLEEARALYEQALAIHRQARYLGAEAMTMIGQASMERRAGSSGAAEYLLQEAERILLETGESFFLATCLCEQGLLALALGRPARPVLEQAEHLAATFDVSPGSELGQDIARLRGAVEAFEAREQPRLFRGELIADLPEGLLRWLAETGQLDLSSGQPGERREHHPLARSRVPGAA
jgi:serine/threonine protein kinase/tetratricopeptide (TPR) repeat protein